MIASRSSYISGMKSSSITGMRKWCAEYRTRFKSYDALKHDVETYMNDYDTIETKRRVESRKRSRQPDADGWITVTKSGRRPVPAAVVASSTSILASSSSTTKRKQQQRKSNQPTLAFYNFQVKQSKLKHLTDLREKFDNDKSRLLAAKAARKFKPY